jgi:hypothetical protein
LALKVTFWQAFRRSAKDAGLGALGGCLIAAFVVACAWLASAGHYAVLAVFVVVVVVGTLAAFARSTQRSAEREEREWRALGFGRHEDP